MSTSLPQSPRRALVTGVAGLIGSNLARELLRMGWEVVGVDDFSSGWEERLPVGEGFRFVRGDVSERGFVARLLADAGSFEACVHLAARVGVRAVLRDPEGCRRSNLAGVAELIAGVSSLPVEQQPRIYAASTSEVYADSGEPLTEGDPTRALDGVGRWAYAASKLEGERQLDLAFGAGAVEQQPVHLRFFNVVGPGQDADSGMVLANFVEQALRGDALTVHGDGSQVRTLALVGEVAKTLAQLIELGTCPPGALNIGGSARTTIADLAQCVIREAHSESRVLSTDPRVDCADFEGIAFREPNLARLANCGVDMPAARLDAIVAETLAFHALEARPAPPVRCASPAS